MSNIIPFDFNGHKVTVLTDDDGSLHFIAMEAAEILGYSDAEALTRRLDADEKQNRQVVGFGNRGVTVISESGLYAAILGSTKSEAKPFQKWVRAEVLPSIRKTGSYSAPKSAVPPLKATAEAAKALAPLMRAGRLLGLDKNAAAIAANNTIYRATQVNLMHQLGAIHLEAEIQDSQWYTPTELGKLINTSARGVNLLLAESGLQMKMGEKWEATEVGQEFSRLFDTGKKHGKGVPVMQMKWSRNVLPMLGEQREAA